MGAYEGHIKKNWRPIILIVSVVFHFQSGLIYSEQEWLEEWNNLAKLASAQPRIHPVAAPPSTGRHSPATNRLASQVSQEMHGPTGNLSFKWR